MRFNNVLAILVLSVQKALSIQVHPDKELAIALHKSQPSIYKDENHKPEMTLALTDFEALCGFICFKELKDVLLTVPEIVDLMREAGKEKCLVFSKQNGNEEEAGSILQSIFSQVMLSSKNTISRMVSKMKTRLNLESKKRQLTDKERLVLRLESQYPSDAGVMAAFLLNYVKLKHGQAFCIGPNELHAYISGECIECMATSDNVVRAGLTNKGRDVQTLISMLKYGQGFPEILHGINLNPYTTRYTSTFDEFEVDRCLLPQSASVVFPSVPGPSIYLFINGTGALKTRSSTEVVREGGVIFVPAYTEISLTAESKELVLYRAGVNSKFFRDLRLKL
ncbi:hypothetical protein ACFE04_029666 [Oxalis oulophora]